MVLTEGVEGDAVEDEVDVIVEVVVNVVVLQFIVPGVVFIPPNFAIRPKPSLGFGVVISSHRGSRFSVDKVGLSHAAM